VRLFRRSIAVMVFAHTALACADDVPYCKDERYSRVPRCFMVLDNSSDGRGFLNIVFIDNASSWPNSSVADLVVTADRSTQNADPTRPGRKGFMRSEDRICVTDRYLAWFDYSIGDGTLFDPKVYGNDKTRAGALAGFWTLDPSRATFRHAIPSPDGSGGLWAPNELISGSASPNGEQYWWDPYAPPIEHTFGIPTKNDPHWSFYLFTYEYAQQSPNSGWQMLADGVRDGQEVRYATSALMTSWKGVVDVVDGEDALDIKNSIEASVEYRCRPGDIVMSWRFKPTTADIVIDNLYTILWLAYTPGIDATACKQKYPDGSPLPGNQWPGPVYGIPQYTRSSELMMNNIEFKAYASGTVNRLPIQEPPCNRRGFGAYPDYHNNSMSTFPGFAVRAGSWMEIGETPGLPAGSQGFRFTILDHPSTGRGTVDDPERVAWKEIGCAHENVDGTIVFGTGNVNEIAVLRAGRWYQSDLAIAPLR
jgi:hypothetical protein